MKHRMILVGESDEKKNVSSWSFVLLLDQWRAFVTTSHKLSPWSSMNSYTLFPVKDSFFFLEARRVDGPQNISAGLLELPWNQQ